MKNETVFDRTKFKNTKQCVYNGSQFIWLKNAKAIIISLLKRASLFVQSVDT